MAARTTPETSAGDATTDSHPGRTLALAILAIGICLFVVLTHSRLTEPFGNSHDGRNAGVWAAGSRALREDGPVSSRIGGVHQDGVNYANHPPLIYVETAVVEAVAGEHPWSTRLPAFASTIAAVLLLYLVLVNAGVARVPAALGVVVGLLTPMMLVYGSMLDTPMTSLAFGVAVLFAWQRQWQHRPLPPVVAGLLATLACLSGWEAMLLTGFAVVALVVRERRTAADLGRGLRSAAPLLVGAVIGTVATLAWATWVYGSIDVLGDQLIRRTSNDEEATRLGALKDQSVWLTNLLGIALLGLVAGVFGAVVDRRIRPLIVLLLATPVVYSLVLYNGAYYHDYWNYWMCLPVACGSAWALNRLSTDLAARGASPALATGLVGAVAVAVMFLGASADTPEATAIDDGFVPGRVVADTSFDASQESTGDIGNTYDASSWLRYVARLPAPHFDDIRQFLAFAAEHPDAQILVSNQCEGGAATGLCSALWPPGEIDTAPIRWRVASASELASEYRERTGA